ncbi:MAG: calcium/sodium antiporter [bacterium]|nr:calcium/sodium antiporter [bacterium]
MMNLFALSLPTWSLWPFAILGLILGMFLLTKSADIFVDGAVSLAKRLAMPPLIIGFVIVGFGTSAPEMIVSVLAAIQGAPVLALGNAYGSNITNILLILGACMIVAPIAIHRVALRRDIPFLMIIMGALATFCAFASTDGLTRIEGVILISAFLAFLSWQIYVACKGRACACEDAETTEAPPAPIGKALLLTLVGLLLLIGASQMLVASAKWIAITIGNAIGMSETAIQLIVGVTIVALGTSLPELMASISATRKGQDDIAVGNVIGSNCFNLCMVAGLAIMIHPVPGKDLPIDLRYRDLFTMIFATLLIWIPGLLLWYRLRKQKPSPHIALGRGYGFLFVSLWIIYTLWVFLATQH